METIYMEMQPQLFIGSDPTTFRAMLSYSKKDPMAIKFTFYASGDSVVWEIDRSMVATGMIHEAGIHDVRIWREADMEKPTTCMFLSSPEGEALIHFDATALGGFLQMTYEMCPLGQEFELLDFSFLDLL